MSYVGDLLKKLEEVVEERRHHDTTEPQAAGDGVTVSNRSQGVRYARQASADACAFCQMLALRPYAQYESDKSAVFGEDGEPYHPGCDCEAIEIGPGDTYQMPAYTEQWVADYNAARDDLDMPGDVASAEDILNHMRRAQYAREHPPEDEPEPALRAAAYGGVVVDKQGNPYHDQRGRFTTGEGAGGGGSQKPTSRVVNMPVSVLLHYSRINPYESDDPAERTSQREYMRGIEDTIRTQGLDAFKNMPVIEVGESGSHAVISEGNHRLWAAAKLGITHVPVVLNTGEDDEWARTYGKPVEAHLRSELHAGKAIAMDVVTKSVDAQVRPIETDDPNGGFEVILSTERLDRDGENLWADEWKQPLPARIHIDSDHGMSVEKTVGSAVPRLEGNQMVGKGTYASTPHAQLVRQLVNEGHITSLSVTYAERKNQKGVAGVQRELLNAAFVAVPANPDAVVLSSKAAKSDEKPKPLTAGSRHADPGYLDRDGNPAKDGNGVPRYQIDDAAHVRSALSYFGQHRGQYTPEQQKLILGRIHARARQVGVEVSGEDDGKKKSLQILAALEAVRKQFGASGNNPVRPGDMIQAIHDASVALGSQCTNLTQADTGEDEGANKAFEEYRSKSSNLTLVGSPQESAVQSAATDTAEKSAVSAAADESADNVAPEALTLKARSLAYLIKQNEEKETG